MKQELKVRIKDYKQVEDKLRVLGGKYLEEINVVDIYFNPPKGEVIKITKDDRGDFFVNLKEVDSRFQIVKYEKVTDVRNLEKELTKKYGVKCILKKKRRFWDFGDFSVNINLIENVGEFLIVEAENPTLDIITKKLQIKNPEFITMSFDNLKKK